MLAMAMEIVCTRRYVQNHTRAVWAWLEADEKCWTTKDINGRTTT
jgi:hypothetical protein